MINIAQHISERSALRDATVDNLDSTFDFSFPSRIDICATPSLIIFENGARKS